MTIENLKNCLEPLGIETTIEPYRFKVKVAGGEYSPNAVYVSVLINDVVCYLEKFHCNIGDKRDFKQIMSNF